MVIFFFDGIKSLLEKADEIKLGDCLFVANEEECGFFVCRGAVYSETMEESLACYEIVKAVANKNSCILCSIDLAQGRFGDIQQIKYLANLFELKEIQNLLDNAIRILSFSADLWEMDVWIGLWNLLPIENCKRFWLSEKETGKINFSSQMVSQKFSPVAFLPRTKEKYVETKYEIFTSDSILSGKKYINGYTLERVDNRIKVIGTLGSKVFDIVYFYDARKEVVGYNRDWGYMLIKSFDMSSFYKEMSLEVYHDGFRIVKDNNDRFGLLNKQLKFLKGKNNWSDMSYLSLGVLLVTTSKSKELISFDTFPEKIFSLVDMVSCEQFHKELFLCTLRNGNQKLVNVRSHLQTNYDFLCRFERITENLICAESKERFWYIFRCDNISKYLYKSSSFPELNSESGELRITSDDCSININLYGDRVIGVSTNDGINKSWNTTLVESKTENHEKVVCEKDIRLDVNVIAFVDSSYMDKKVDATGCLYLTPRKTQFPNGFQKKHKVLWVIMGDTDIYYTTYSKIKAKHCFLVENKYCNKIVLDRHMQSCFPLMFEVNRILGIRSEVRNLLCKLWESKLNNPKKRIFFPSEEIDAILKSDTSQKEEHPPLVEDNNIDTKEEPSLESKSNLWQDDSFLTEIMIAYKKLLAIGFDEGHIYEALLMLYPTIEDKELQSHFGATLLELRNDILELLGVSVAESDKSVLNKLDCDTIQLGTINYYREIKGYTLELSVKCTIQDLARNLAYVASAQDLEKKFKMLVNREQMIINKRIQLIQEIISYGLEKEKQMDIKQIPDDSFDSNSVESDFDEINCGDTVQELVPEIKTINRNGICMLNSNDIPILEFGKKYAQFNFHKKTMNNYYEKWNCVLIFLPYKKTVEFDRQGTGIYEIMGEGNDKRLSQNFGANANGKIKNQKINGKRILIFRSLDTEFCEFYDEVEYVTYSMKIDETSLSKREVIYFVLKSKLRFS